jgi:peptide/nickel transport system substrate-binding protein
MTRTLIALTVLLATAFAAAQERPHLRVGVTGVPDGLDPAVNINIGANGFRVLYSVFDGLIHRNFLDGGLTPALAESWEWLNDRTLELRLRQGVMFHDGRPFTSADVVYTFERVLDPDSPYVTARGTFANIASVEPVGTHTVWILTHEPDPVLEQVLTLQQAYIVPEGSTEGDAATAFNQRPIGTGPFQVESFATGDHLTLAVNDDYWGGRPNASGVTFRVIPETSARITALVNNEVDIIVAIPPDQVATAAGFPNVEVVNVPLSNIHMLRYNANHPVLQDVRVRQAMNLAIDRQLLSDAFWGGQAIVPRSHQFVDFGDMYDPERPVTPYDPEAARTLLAESEYDGEPIVFNAHPTWYVNGLNAAEAIVEMWRAVGLNAEVRVVPGPAELFGLSPDDPMAMVNSWSNSMRYADPAGGLWSLWGPFGPPQGSGYWNAPDEFNQLGQRSLQIRDQEQRFQNYTRMLDIWEEAAPGTVLYYAVESYGLRSGVQWIPYSDFHMDFRPHNLSFE